MELDRDLADRLDRFVAQEFEHFYFSALNIHLQQVDSFDLAFFQKVLQFNPGDLNAFPSPPKIGDIFHDAGCLGIIGYKEMNRAILSADRIVILFDEGILHNPGKQHGIGLHNYASASELFAQVSGELPFVRP